MARTSLLFLLLLSTSFFLLPSSSACGINVYWGQNGDERPLRSACASTYYEYVTIAFLTTFGGGQTPVLNLAGHCDPLSGECTALYSDIRNCQSRGIKVLLSIGGAVGSYGLTSAEDAAEVASYLWNNFLSGSDLGPLGPAALDGIDFAISNPLSPLHWDDLARSIAAYSTPERKIYLSAAPQCIYPDRNLDAAIKTGLFDYVWVQFYNNPQCDYSGGGVVGLLAAWNAWSWAVPAGSQIFMGLPASPEAATTGYVDLGPLWWEILPVARRTGNYGGVMLWNRHYDLINGYTVRMKVPVCQEAPSSPSTAAV